MSKKKSNPPEAWDKAGPAGGSLMEGYTWCPECQAAYEGEVCPGCVDVFGAGAYPAPAAVAEGVASKAAKAFEAGQTTEAGVPEPDQSGDKEAIKGPGNVPPELVGADHTCEACGATYLADKCPMCGEPRPPTTLAEVAEQAFTETTTITEILPVPLSDPEYKEFGIKLGLANQEISQAEDELASVKSQYKARITSAEGRRNEYSSVINAGHQQKSVECHLVKDFIENTITLIRLDTGEIVRTRTMTSAERQRGLFQPPPPDPSCIDPTD